MLRYFGNDHLDLKIITNCDFTIMLPIMRIKNTVENVDEFSQRRQNNHIW